MSVDRDLDIFITRQKNYDEYLRRIFVCLIDLSGHSAIFFSLLPFLSLPFPFIIFTSFSFPLTCFLSFPSHFLRFLPLHIDSIPSSLYLSFLLFSYNFSPIHSILLFFLSPLLFFIHFLSLPFPLILFLTSLLLLQRYSLSSLSLFHFRPCCFGCLHPSSSMSSFPLCEYLYFR